MKIPTLKDILLLVAFIYAVTLLERFMSTYKEQAQKTLYDVKKERFEIKINNYETGIFEDSVVIYNSNREYRDSIRESLNPSR